MASFLSWFVPLLTNHCASLFPIACWCCAIRRKVGVIPETQPWDEISPVTAIERVYGSPECRQHIEVSGCALIWGKFYCVLTRRSSSSAAKATELQWLCCALVAGLWRQNPHLLSSLFYWSRSLGLVPCSPCNYKEWTKTARNQRRWSVDGCDKYFDSDLAPGCNRTPPDLKQYEPRGRAHAQGKSCRVKVLKIDVL